MSIFRQICPKLFHYYNAFGEIRQERKKDVYNWLNCMKRNAFFLHNAHLEKKPKTLVLFSDVCYNILSFRPFIMRYLRKKPLWNFFLKNVRHCAGTVFIENADSLTEQ